MWFKNATFYTFSTKEFFLDADVLSEALEDAQYTPMPDNSAQVRSVGFVPPMGDDVAVANMLIHAASNRLMVCFMTEDKDIPISAVNDKLKERVLALEESENRKLSRKERAELKQAVTEALIPKAFTKKNKTYLFIDLEKGLVVVNSASGAQCENITSALRSCLGSFPIYRATTKEHPQTILTSWLRDQNLIPEDLSLGSQCSLIDLEKSSAKLTKVEDMSSDEVLIHLDHGKEVDQLELVWCNNITFNLKDLALKNLKYSDYLQEQVDDYDSDDAAGRFDSEFIIMTEELIDLFDDIMEAFGGLAATE